jgi:endonuclease/exonuclease/phosphatase family metal-dependent hydrolase
MSPKDPLDISRHTRFADIVRLSPQQPDVIFLQEAKWFNHYGDELLFHVEHLLRDAGIGTYRGFPARLRRSYHQVVFIRTDRPQAVHHWRRNDADESTGLYGWVDVIVDGYENWMLWLKSFHLDPRDGCGRLVEVNRIHRVVAVERPLQHAILAGDFNSYTSRRTLDEGEPQRRFAAMELAKRSMWVDTEEILHSDHRALGGVVAITGGRASRCR